MGVHAHSLHDERRPPVIGDLDAENLGTGEALRSELLDVEALATAAPLPT